MADNDNLGLAITRISTRHHAGKVYNLSVHGDETYVAEGAVVHNCRCRVVTRGPGELPNVVEASSVASPVGQGFTSGTGNLLQG